MSLYRFPTANQAVQFAGYRVNDDVWIDRGTELGAGGSGYFKFQAGSPEAGDLSALAVLSGGHLARTSSTLAQYEALAERLKAELATDMAALREGQADLVEQQQALASAMVALPALIAAQMKSGDPLSIAGEVTAAEINSTLKGSPQPIEGQVALPSDVVNAIGSAVNTALRGGGALSTSSAQLPTTLGAKTTAQSLSVVIASAQAEYPAGTSLPFPVEVTLTDSVAKEIVVKSVDLPRKLSLEIVGDAEVTVKYRYRSGGKLWNEGTFTFADAEADLQLSIVDRLYSITVQRTAGTSTASVVVLS